MSWKVYIIQTDTGKLYTGITTDLERRVAEHLSGQKGARFFNFSNPKLFYFKKSILAAPQQQRERLK